MLLSESVKPISYIKAHASEVLEDVARTRSPIIITQNGHAKAVIQDLRSYEEMQESLAMMKVVLAGRKDIEDGCVKPLDEAFKSIRKKIQCK
jgi:prevent-host-death family protein